MLSRPRLARGRESMAPNAGKPYTAGRPSGVRPGACWRLVRTPAMNLPTAVLLLRCLILDTFRQAAASGILWLMVGLSGLCILLCLSVGVTGDVPLRGGDEPAEFLPRSAAVDR